MQKMRNILIVSILSLLSISHLKAQDIVANSQTNSTTGLCLACTVTNPNNSVDGDDATFATMQTTASLLAGALEQTLTFPMPGVAGDTVVLLLDAADDLLLNLNLLGNITASSFLGPIPNNDGTVISAANLTVLNNNAFEFRFYPTAAFNSVQIRMTTGVLSLATTLKIFSAKIKRTQILPGGFGIVDCTNPTSQTNSITGLCLAGLCGVTNPTAIISADESDFATLRVTAGLLGGSAEITGIFAEQACSTDSATIVLENPGNVLTANVLGSIQINALLNGTVVFTQTVQGNNLSALAGSNLYAYNFKPNTNFNAIQVVLVGGPIISALANLNVYQMCLKRLQAPRPAPNNAIKSICFNTPATFTAIPAPGAVVRWYDQPTGGNLLFTGNTFVTGPLINDTTYYIESFVAGGAGCASTKRDSVMALIYPQVPNATDPQDDVFTCFNTRAFITPKPLGSVFNFYSDPAGVNLLFTGGTYVTDTVLKDTLFYVENTFQGICNSNVYVPVRVKLIPDAFSSNLPDTLLYCVNSTITVNIQQPVPGITYRWFNLAGDTVFVGNPLTGFVLSSDTTLLVETVSGTCNQSPNRDTLFIQAVTQPDVTLPNDTIYVCAGDTALLFASSTNPNATYNWYKANDPINSVFTGNPYKVAESNGDTLRFFVESTFGRCASATRQQLTLVSLRNIANNYKNDTTIVCRGSSAVLTVNANIANANYTWYTTPTGGTAIGTGSPFTTPAVTNNFTVFYFEVSGVSCVNMPRFAKTVDVVDTKPTVTQVRDLVYYCSSDSITLQAKATPTNATINWWTAAAGGTKLFEGANYRIAPTGNQTLYAQANIDQCPSSARAGVDIINADSFNAPSTTNVDICAGDAAKLTATTSVQGATFSWWTAAVGGTKLSTGLTYNTPRLNTTTTYFVQLEFADTSICSSRARTPLTVNVSPILDAPIVSCGPADNTFVSFTWNNVSGATAYKVSLDGGMTFIDPNNLAGPRTHVVNGLSPDSTVTIIVIAVNSVPCATSKNSFAVSCTANPCGLNNVAVQQPFYEACQGTPIDVILEGMNADTRVVINNNYADVRSADTTNPRILTYTVPATTPAGSYTLRFKVYVDGNVGCDTLLITTLVRVNPNPIADIDAIALVPASPGAFIDTYQFLSNTVGDSIWAWKFGDGGTSTEKNPVYKYAAEGQYTVTLFVTNSFGCTGADTLDRPIFVTTVPDIFIPNTFTPNGDGKNDLFGVFGQNIKVERLRVFNSYGNVVFESTDIANKWNGQYNGEPAPATTYKYTAEIRDSFGNKIIREGTITIIRK